MITETEVMKPLVDWLTYRSYEWQRLSNPDRPFRDWRKIFHDAVIFEEIYENSIKKIHGVNPGR